MRPAVPRQADVLLLAAVKDEYFALKEQIVPDGSPGGWQVCRDKANRAVLLGRFKRGEESSDMVLLVAWSGGMGEDKTYERAIDLTDEVGVKVVAMCGVCAGDPKNTNAGDLILGKESWKHGPGKVSRSYDAEPERGTESRENDIQILPLMSDSIIENTIEYFSIFKKTFEKQLDGMHPDQKLNLDSYKCVPSAIQCVPDVTIDEKAFANTKTFKRNTYCLEMESFSIARVASKRRIQHVIFIKSVQDQARQELGSSGKSDKYRNFAARSSAIFTIELLRNTFDDLLRDQEDIVRHRNYSRGIEEHPNPTSSNMRKAVKKPVEAEVLVSPHNPPGKKDLQFENSLGSDYSCCQIVRIENGREIDRFKAYANAKLSIYIPAPDKWEYRRTPRTRIEICKSLCSRSVSRNYNSYLASAKIYPE